MLDNYSRAGKETGYWGRRFLAEIKRKGGLAVAKRMLKPSQSDTITGGWQALIDANLMQLSVENSALKPEFHDLFSKAELSEAQRRISLLPDYLRPQIVAPEKVFPDEISDEAEYPEGAKKQVVVNAYERNPKAREACIAKFGPDCSVCGMSFLERYGELAKDFIHVHHKKPLGARRGEYKLNPRLDLIPVCPNCHAVLHMSNPPMGVEELKMIYQNRNKSANNEKNGINLIEIPK
jgi:5-methylcytosine-specific restriction protein A